MSISALETVAARSVGAVTSNAISGWADLDGDGVRAGAKRSADLWGCKVDFPFG